MIRTFFIVILLFWLPLGLWSQNLPDMQNYQPARSTGTIPKDILESTTEKYEKAKGNSTQSDKDLQKAEDEFYLKTNYSVDQILHSGTVMVNDSMGMYVNRVADSLLAHDPELRSKINIYILRSPVVNAFATDRGSIFITIGLLTRLHNEAELAYVLAHEIIHYKRRHVLTGYIEGVQMEEGKGKYEATTFENRFLKRHSYARTQETQADEEGFDLLVKSNYDPKAALGAFEILAMADFPFTDTAFSKEIFETEFFIFPSKYQPDTIKEYKIDEEEEDHDLATHPSVFKRRKNITRRYKKLETDSTGQRFLVSESMFWRVQAMARFEEVALHTNSGEYGEALYLNQSIQKNYPANYYLEKEMVRSLYASVIEKNSAFNFEDLAALLEALFGGAIGGDDEKPIGEMGRAKAFLDKTDRDGWNVAVLKYTWKIHQKYPDDQDIANWCKGLFRELTLKNDLRIKDFSKNDSLFLVTGNKIMSDTGLVGKMNKDTPVNRFRVAIDHLKKDSIEDIHYWQFAFIEELKDSSFVKMFRDACIYADSTELADSLINDLGRSARNRLERQEKEEFYGPQGLEKIVIVNPVFVAYDSRQSNDQLDVRKSIEGRLRLMEVMKETSEKVGLKTDFLDPDKMDSTSMDKFNDLMVVNEWFEQRGNFKRSSLLPVNQTEMEKMADKYGTKYFLWSAYYTSREPRRWTVTRALSLVLTPIAPHTAYRLATPRENIYFVALLYDVTTGKAVWGVETTMENQKPTDARMKLHVYDMMNMLAKPKKKKK